MRAYLVAALILMLLALGQESSYSDSATMPSTAPVPPSSGPAVDETEFNMDMANLPAVLKGASLKEAQTYVDGIEKKWSKREGSEYCQLILVGCERLASDLRFGVEGRILAENYALRALLSQHPMSVEIQARLALCINAPQTAAEAARLAPTWAEVRLKRSEAWCAAWHRLRAAIDLNFNPKDIPPLHPAMPQGANLPGGAAPESISDPQIRAEYERKIEANHQAYVYFVAQRQLREILPIYQDAFIRRLSRAYSFEPMRLGELNDLLKKSIDDPAIVQNVMDATRKLISAETKSSTRPAESP